MNKTIFKVKFGSHLYGTSTPESDTDYKSVHIPDGKSIIMQRVENVISRSTGSDTVKNTADDVDDESYSLAKFFSMCMTGDMVAYELLFVDERDAEIMDDDWYYFIHVNRYKLMSANIKGFVSYIRGQVNKYGIKGSRIATARAARDLFQLHSLGYTNSRRVGDISMAVIEEFCKENDHAEIVYLPSIKGSDSLFPYINILDRKIDFRISINDAYKLMDKIFNEYGSRAIAAEAGTGVDWKSVYHAVRVSEQALELTRTGKIIFPRPNVDDLLDIRRGNQDFKAVVDRLEHNLDMLEEEMPNSVLPMEYDVTYMDRVLENLYTKAVLEYHY